MDEKITLLEVPAGSGKSTRRYFEGAISLSEKENVPITKALETFQRLNPKAFVDYLLEQGIITEETARELLGSR